MTHVVAIINLKGGVGKTTTTAALGEFLAGEFGKRVLLIDLDPQTNLTTMMLGEHRWGELDAAGRTLAGLFKRALAGGVDGLDGSDLVVRDASPLSAVAGVDLIPSSLELIGIQDRLSAIGERSTEILSVALAQTMQAYDYVLIDCPPNLGTVTLNGIRIADGFIIPTIPDHMSRSGIAPVQKRIGDAAEGWGRKIVDLGVIITKYRTASKVHRNTIDILSRNPEIRMVFPSYIPEANQIAAAAEHAPFGTLRRRYGTGEPFARLQELSQDFLATTQVRLGW